MDESSVGRLPAEFNYKCLVLESELKSAAWPGNNADARRVLGPLIHIMDLCVEAL